MNAGVERHFQTIQLDIRDQIARIALHRPKQWNALNAQMIEELHRAIEMVEQSGKSAEGVGAVLIIGDDRAFAAGADVRELASYTQPEQYLEFISNGHDAFQRLEQLDQPSIAVLRGVALGGGLELSLACDFRIATPTARFGIPEINLGLIPGWGGASRLAKLLPLPKWKEMLMTGESVSALEALQFGLVNRIVPEPSVLDEAEKLVKLLVSKPPLAMKMAKRLAHAQRDAGLQISIELEKHIFSFLFGTEDRIEGTTAFLEKRQPVWRGR